MIVLNNLVKKLKENIIIDNLSLTINSGEITALVGKNGAGKSTLIRLISGILKPNSGTIEIISDLSIGVLLGGDVNLYENLTAYEIISYFGNLYGLSQKNIDERINELDKVLNFNSFINKKAYTFSRGMKQKIALVISIIHNPDILLLDEPSTGLDLESVNDVVKFIKYLKSKNKTILIATHNIFEIVELSDNIAFLNQGKIQRKVSTSEFFKNSSQDKSNTLIQAMEVIDEWKKL